MTSHTTTLNRFSKLFSRCFYIRTKLFIVILFIGPVLMLTGCGGGGSGSGGNSNRELQLYQDAVIAYQASNYSDAITLFGLQLAEFPNGSYSNESQYKLGRSYHALNDFVAARNAYSVVSSSSTWVDNADFYIGKSYYDEAGTFTNPVMAFTAYDSAITRLGMVITTYTTSGFVNESYYYMGRSYQKQASIKQNTPSVSTKTELALFGDARTRYDLVQPTSIFYDNALYFKGRSYHEQVPADYMNARLTYQQLIVENTSNWADDAKYQYGKTFYDEAGSEPVAADAMSGFNNAISEFDGLITSTNSLYQTSNRADSARYYKGRSLHKQAALVEADPTLDSTNNFGQYYQNARNIYQSVIDFDAVGVYADNAQYRIGKTYYDEAQIALRQVDYPLMQQNLNNSIVAFNVVITDMLYQLSNSADNAYYYLGRSYQRAAEIPSIDRISVSGGIDFTTVTYAMARMQYEVLTGVSSVPPRYPGSAWIDNAYYEIGNTWYAEAQTAIDPLANYTVALVNYNKVLTDYPNSSIREDNSASQIAAIYHEAGYCSDEQAVLNYLVTNITSASAAKIAAANIHLNDLSTAMITPTAVHPCVINTPGLPGFTL